MKRTIFLCLVLGFALLMNACSITGFVPYQYDRADEYRMGGDEVPGEDVHSLYIDWTVGEVVVRYHDKNTVGFSEKSVSPISDGKTLHYALFDGVLNIRFAKHGENTTNFFGKTLTVYLPRDLTLEACEIHAVSAKVNIEDTVAKQMTLSSVSGDVIARNIVANENLLINNVSGKIDFTLARGYDVEVHNVSGQILATLQSVNSFKSSAVSSSTTVEFTVAPKVLDVESVSGFVNLIFPEEGTNATIQYETVSGSFSCTLPHTGPSGGTIVIGTGEYLYRVETTSSAFRIN